MYKPTQTTQPTQTNQCWDIHPFTPPPIKFCNPS